ncbi:MAG: YceK/YidQ family lipoprotein [Candidatus Omnitrophica bacterium]|nr:YceK/YidQ family lipoprotein [Candidatus Omnitrophota bacterium]
MKKIFIILILVIFVLISMMSAYFHRAKKDSYPIYQEIYPSLSGDLACLMSFINKTYDPLLTGIEHLVFTVALLDVPFAAISDTALLPYDIFQTMCNTHRVTKLLNKYYPGFKISRNPHAAKDSGAYFSLISPSGEKIVFERFAEKSPNIFISPQLNKFLDQNKIQILNEKQAEEIITIIDAVIYNFSITDWWKYQVERKDNSWIIIRIDKKTGQVRLGNEDRLQLDSKGFLQKVTMVISDYGL